jgi:quinolinate synthase
LQVRDLLGRFHYFKQGNCIVHHMFGSEVVHRVRREYGGAYHTAHLEVPGEMFALAMQAQDAGRGVVGSTSNILSFIVAKTRAALQEGREERLQFVLGTEAGMITSIVRGVERLLKEAPEAAREKVQVEIVFPVAADAVAATGGAAEDGLAVVPGVKGGEGCSTAGGCATCPFMKMNSLEALVEVMEQCKPGRQPQAPLRGFLPPKRDVQLVSRKSVSAVGSLPIVHMRALMQAGQLPLSLVQDVESRVPVATQGQGQAGAGGDPMLGAAIDSDAGAVKNQASL